MLDTEAQVDITIDYKPRLRAVDAIPIRENGEELVVLRDQEGFAEQLIAVSVHLAPILAQFDGLKTLTQIASQLKTPDGSKIDPERLIDIVRMLSDNYLLENETFFERRSQVLNQFRNTPVREMAMAAGGFPTIPEQFQCVYSIHVEST